MIYADVDGREPAALVRIGLRRTCLLMFGSAKAGTPVMVANPLAALELPLRLVVWEDDGADVRVDYRARP